MTTPLKQIPRAQPVLTLKLAGYPITLQQNERSKLFTVTYGAQVDDRLSYGHACHKLGAAILHALACESKIDNSAS